MRVIAHSTAAEAHSFGYSRNVHMLNVQNCMHLQQWEEGAGGGGVHASTIHLILFFP